MKHIKLLSMAILAASGLLLSSACSDDNKGNEGNEEQQEVQNILIIKGNTYNVKYALYMGGQGGDEGGMYGIDLDTEFFGTEEEQNQIHGYGKIVWDGNDVTVDVAKQDAIYTSGFNWLSGGGYYEADNYKSGTQTVKNGKNGTIILIVDCIDKDGDRFYLNVEAVDEDTFNAMQQQ